ncbi:MAG TPA: hypothetical protein VN968_25555, partial [Bradyrhizobium sp.]|nr:hypothetical protein [Bradyrhizobium sp.]
VDELKRETGNRKVKRFRLKRKRLGISIRQIDASDFVGAPGQGGADLIAHGADIGRRLELPQHCVQSFSKILGDAIEQECCGP